MKELTKSEDRSTWTLVGKIASAVVLGVTLGLIGLIAASYLALSSAASISFVVLMSACGAIIGWCWWERVLTAAAEFVTAT